MLHRRSNAFITTPAPLAVTPTISPSPYSRPRSPLLLLTLLLTAVLCLTVATDTSLPTLDGLPLRHAVDTYLSSGGHAHWRRALDLPPGVHYNPLHFFTRSDVPGTPSSARLSDAELLRKMRLPIPGVDPVPQLVHQLEGEDSDTSRGGCHADKSPTPIQVPGGLSTLLVFFSPVSQQVKNVMIHAAKQWAMHFRSNVTIRVCFEWDSLGEGTLGAQSTAFFIPGSDHAALKDNVTYTPALGVSLVGTSVLKPQQKHLKIILNRETLWHLDIDSEATDDRFDLPTTILHELTHGLFFTGAIQADVAKGSASFSLSTVSRFDQFIQAEGNISVARSCSLPNRKSDLYNAVRSPQLSFVGSNFRIGLFAPRTFQRGSSIYHFNNETIDADCSAQGLSGTDCSDLMTHELRRGYTNRNLGETTLGVYKLMRGNSNGVSAQAPCVVAEYPADDNAASGGGGAGGDDLQFVLSPVVIIVVAVVGGIGIMLVVGVVISTVVARR